MRTRTTWSATTGEHGAKLTRTAQKRYVLKIWTTDATGFVVEQQEQRLRHGPVEARRQAEVLWELYLVRRDAR